MEKILRDPTFLISGIIGLILIGFISLIFMKIVKNSDNRKTTIQKNIRVIEKPQQNSSLVYWITVEFDDGTRQKLRIFDQNIILAVGDEGTIEFRGQTIVNFSKKSDN